MKPYKHDRFNIVDQLRGVAFLLMMVHHGHYFPLVSHHYHPYYTVPTYAQVCGTISRYIFITLAGASSVFMARIHNHHWSNTRLCRSGTILCHALLVSVITYLAYGQYRVIFGTLHFISFATIISYPLTRLPCYYTMIVGVLIHCYQSWLSFKLDIFMLWMCNISFQTDTGMDYFSIVKWLPVYLSGLFVAHLTMSISPILLSCNEIIATNSNSKVQSYLRLVMQVVRGFCEWIGRQSLSLYTSHIAVLCCLCPPQL